MGKYVCSLSRMWALSALIVALLTGSALAKDPTLKERITALANAGKTIPVVYWPSLYSGDMSDSAGSLATTPIFNGGTIPAIYSTVGQTAVESFNKGFSVTAFSPLSVDTIPMKQSWTGAKTPDWTTLDNELLVSVGVSARNGLIRNKNGSKSVKLTVWAEVQIMEITIDKKGNKKASAIKTLNASVSSKVLPATETVASQADFEKIIPAASLLEGLKTAVDQEIVKYITKQ